jgi:phosphate transport system permease protein
MADDAGEPRADESPTGPVFFPDTFVDAVSSPYTIGTVPGAEIPTPVPTAPLPEVEGEAGDDRPRVIVAPTEPADQVFRGVLRAAGLTTFVIMGLIALFLALRSTRALHRAGWHFLTEQRWSIGAGHFGIAALLPDGFFIAVIALLVAVPVAISTALFIAEYAPVGLRRLLITLIDLMAAVPSIIYGLWGLYFLQPRIIGPIRFVANHLAFLPFFKVRTGDYTFSYTSSTTIAGVVVGLMIIPITTALSREVFSQAPVGEREAAYALGSTRWGMVRTVVLPYARGGMIGAVMLGFGRAMGETITVALIVSPAFKFNFHVLEGSGISISSLIALRFGDSDALSLSALMGAGLVLFAVTLIVNSLASIVINRSRTGAST